MDDGGNRRRLADAFGGLLANEQRLAGDWERLRHHHAVPDIGQQGALFAAWSLENVAAIQTHADRVGYRDTGPAVTSPDGQASLAPDLLRDLQGVASRNERQRDWLLGRMRLAAPQALAVPGNTGTEASHD